MKSTDELRELYENQLKPALQSIEGERLILKKKYIYTLVGILVPLFSIPIFDKYVGFVYISIVFIIELLAFWYLMKLEKEKKGYREKFKKSVVKEIVSLINPDWSYDSEGMIPQQDFEKSGLFNIRIDNYEGDDFVKGVIEKTYFQFSELKVEHRRKGNDNKTEWSTIFKGLFAHAEFNKEIQGKTFVYPETPGKLGKIMGKVYVVNKKSVERVKLENPEFEELYEVYGTNQTESRYVLTPAMMEAMVNIRNQYGNLASFSFVGSKVYVAMSFAEDLFEPNIFTTGINFEDVEQMNSHFRIIQTIVRELNLNTRIWTKQ